jgi:hypothetical protein
MASVERADYSLQLGEVEIGQAGDERAGVRTQNITPLYIRGRLTPSCNAPRPRSTVLSGDCNSAA